MLSPVCTGPDLSESGVWRLIITLGKLYFSIHHLSESFLPWGGGGGGLGCGYISSMAFLVGQSPDRLQLFLIEGWGWVAGLSKKTRNFFAYG